MFVGEDVDYEVVGGHGIRPVFNVVWSFGLRFRETAQPVVAPILDLFRHSVFVI